MLLKQHPVVPLKIFVCMPFKGRTDSDILYSFDRVSEVIRNKFTKPVEIIHNFYEKAPPKGTANPSVWYLGKALEKIANADYLIYIRGVCESFRGCEIEKTVAREYGIKTMGVSTSHAICPDLKKANTCIKK
jgi:hypothetical protein